MTDEKVNTMGLLGITIVPKKDGEVGKKAQMGGSQQLQLYEKNGWNNNRNVDHLKGTVEDSDWIIQESVLAKDFARSPYSEADNKALAFDAFIKMEQAFAALKKDGKVKETMIEYAIRTITEKAKKDAPK